MKAVVCTKYGPPEVLQLQEIDGPVLKAVALGMVVVSLMLGFLPDAADVSTRVTLLSIGLFTLALDTLEKQ